MNELSIIELTEAEIDAVSGGWENEVITYGGYVVGVAVGYTAGRYSGYNNNKSNNDSGSSGGGSVS